MCGNDLLSLLLHSYTIAQIRMNTIKIIITHHLSNIALESIISKITNNSTLKLTPK